MFPRAVFQWQMKLNLKKYIKEWLKLVNLLNIRNFETMHTYTVKFRQVLTGLIVLLRILLFLKKGHNNNIVKAVASHAVYSDTQSQVFHLF